MIWINKRSKQECVKCRPYTDSRCRKKRPSEGPCEEMSLILPRCKQILQKWMLKTLALSNAAKTESADRNVVSIALAKMKLAALLLVVKRTSQNTSTIMTNKNPNKIVTTTMMNSKRKTTMTKMMLLMTRMKRSTSTEEPSPQREGEGSTNLQWWSEGEDDRKEGLQESLRRSRDTNLTRDKGLRVCKVPNILVTRLSYMATYFSSIRETMRTECKSTIWTLFLREFGDWLMTRMTLKTSFTKKPGVLVSRPTSLARKLSQMKIYLKNTSGRKIRRTRWLMRNLASSTRM